MISIKDITGKIRFSFVENTGSVYRKTLMKEDYILLHFNVDQPVLFEKGDYCETEFGRFEIVDLVFPKYNTSTGGYDYELRLDAEYYQPKYEAIARSLNTSETVRSLCRLHDEPFLPKNHVKYPYIELADVGQSGDISGVDVQYGAELPTRARRVVKSGQILVASVEGSMQSCALITDEYDGALCSTGFYVLDSDKMNAETLLVLFKSEPIQTLMKQRCSGTILTAISKDELLSMALPLVDARIQEGIAAKVQEAFALRKQAKQLLEYAKQGVEMAIEQGEDAALGWLHDQVG